MQEMTGASGVMDVVHVSERHLELRALKRHVQSMTMDERKSFAESVGTTPNHLAQIYYGNRPCSIEYAVAIDRLTAGRISMVRLLPDIDWSYIRKAMRSNKRA